MKNKWKSIYYCEYDGMVVFRSQNDDATIIPRCKCEKYLKDAIKISAYSYEFISYGYTVI